MNGNDNLNTQFGITSFEAMLDLVFANLICTPQFPSRFCEENLNFDLVWSNS